MIWLDFAFLFIFRHFGEHPGDLNEMQIKIKAIQPQDLKHQE